MWCRCAAVNGLRRSRRTALAETPRTFTAFGTGHGWAEQIRDKIRYHEPANLGVEDRAADVWEPLIAVADMAGGHWPTTARAAAKALVAQAAEDDADSTNIKLLSDIRDVFANMVGVSFLKSSVLCDELKKIADSPWSQFDLNPSKLGRRLRDYQIKTGRNTTGSERGYRLDDLQDAFERYLPGFRNGPSRLLAGREGVRSRQKPTRCSRPARTTWHLPSI